MIEEEVTAGSLKMRIYPLRDHVGRIAVILLGLLGPQEPIHALPPTLVDIVQTKNIDSVSISPDGDYVAYRLLVPSLERNRTTAQWYRVAAGGRSKAVALGIPLDPIIMPEFDVPFEGVASWIPGSANLAVLAQRASRRQVWEVSSSRAMRQLTHDSADVEDFDVSEDGRWLRYKVRNPVSVVAKAQADEENTGIHFDRTVFAEGMRLTRNFRIGDRETTVRREGPAGIVDLGVQVGRGILREKTIRLTKRVQNVVKADRPRWQDAVLTPGTASTGVPWITAGSSLVWRPTRSAEDVALGLQILRPSRSPLVCASEVCQPDVSKVREAVVLRGSREVVFLAERLSTGRTGIYGWRPEDGRMRTVFEPTSSLSGGTGFGPGPCPIVETSFVCVQEGATVPPRLVRIDARGGALQVLADPNRRLAMKDYPKPQFVEWSDKEGRYTNGVLLLPPGAERRLPLVITTYNCRGFLRGGTGMAVPEFLLVQRGIAALCVNYDDRWDDRRDLDGVRIPAGAARAAASSYVAAVQKLSSEGLIDPKRVGVAGHSLSANAVAYAVSHGDGFAAAMLSTGTTFDPMSYTLTAPTADNWRDIVYTGQGLPIPYEGSLDEAEDISPALNASRIHAAILFQPPEDEWLFALQLYSAIQHHGGVADMYIYPGAGHDPNLLPTHHYWRNLRGLDWFEYWLGPTPSGAEHSLAGFNSWEQKRLIQEDPPKLTETRN
ncbi:prolyl oligopeptidase family serine peptidase [Sphingomonas oryzagri]